MRFIRASLLSLSNREIVPRLFSSGLQLFRLIWFQSLQTLLEFTWFQLTLTMTWLDYLFWVPFSLAYFLQFDSRTKWRFEKFCCRFKKKWNSPETSDLCDFGLLSPGSCHAMKRCHLKASSAWHCQVSIQMSIRISYHAYYVLHKVHGS